MLVRDRRFAYARRYFRPQREHLEARFVQLLSGRSEMQDARWLDCDFDDDVSYVRNRITGELSAFVAVTIAAENAEDLSAGSGEAIGNLRAGTAVFRFDGAHWNTDGKTLFNLSPAEAVRCYQDDLEIVKQTPVRQP